jgi:uncharacterized protein (TIGR03435 family)
MLNVWKKCLITTALFAAIIGPTAVGVLNAPRLQAQSSASGATRPPEFEVASIKANNSGEQRTSMRALPGRIEGTNRTLKLLIQNAYRLQDFQIVGGPGWLNSARFDISAKADGAVTQAEVALMLRKLLADRFKLISHTETREMALYALARSRTDGSVGAQLRASNADCLGERSSPRRPQSSPSPGQAPECGFRESAGNMMARGIDLDAFAAELAAYASRPVVDKTALIGKFDLTLNWTPEQSAPPDGSGSPPADPNQPSIFTALQEQLGLKLESTRGPVDVLVIDSAEKPSDN